MMGWRTKSRFQRLACPTLKHADFNWFCTYWYRSTSDHQDASNNGHFGTHDCQSPHRWYLAVCWEASYAVRLDFTYPNTKPLPAACTDKESCFLLNLSLSICVSDGRCWEDSEWVQSQTFWTTELKSISISTRVRGNWQGANPRGCSDSAVMEASEGDGTRLFSPVHRKPKYHLNSV